MIVEGNISIAGSPQLVFDVLPSGIIERDMRTRRAPLKALREADGTERRA